MIYDLTADVDPEDPRTLAEALIGSRQGLAQSFSPVFCCSVVEQNIVLILLCFFVVVVAESGDSAVQERLDRITRMTEIEDLRESHDHPVAPLCIKVHSHHHTYNQLFLCRYGSYLSFLFV